MAPLVEKGEVNRPEASRWSVLRWLAVAALGIVVFTGCLGRHGGIGLGEVVGVDGAVHRPLAQAGLKAAVFIFLSNECPAANRTAPEIARLHREFGAGGVSFWMVHADPDETADSIRRHAVEYGLPGTVIRDPGYRLAKMTGVRKTPEAAVILPDGRLVYRGRVDDRYVALGRERTVVTRRDVAEVLEAIVAGRSVVPRFEEAVGCHIPMEH